MKISETIGDAAGAFVLVFGFGFGGPYALAFVAAIFGN